MAQADWAIVSGSLSAAQTARGVSSGFAVPNGGGTFVHGFNSLSTAVGFSGRYVNLTNFAPLLNNAAGATGGSVQFAVQKRTSSGTAGWAAFAFTCLRSGSSASPAPSVNDTGYLFGLEDQSPYRIVCIKGTPQTGLPSTATTSLLRSSSTTFTAGQWHHLRMDVIVNPSGDVVLRFFSNALTTNTVAAPAWTAIAGMTDYTDDALGVLSGSAPLSGGFVGMGMWSNVNGRQAFFDHFQALRAQ